MILQYAIDLVYIFVNFGYWGFVVQLNHQKGVRLNSKFYRSMINKLVSIGNKLMICCLNPSCPQENPPCSEDMNYCTSCGQPLILLLNRYQPIGRTIADESMVAYFARDREGLVNDCIIRQLSIHNPQVGESAELEVKRLQELSRENSQLGEILNYHMDGKYLYLIQSFVEGQSLQKYLDSHEVFSETEAIDFLNSMLPVLQSVHNNNIIHRDLRLDNIIRRSNGELVLTNFAVTRQSTGNIFEFDIGTPGYTAFELKEQSISSPASDLYSLGAACFHLLTGKDPQIAFGDFGYDWTSKWQKYLDPFSTKAAPSKISDNLSKIVDKLLQKNDRDRYQSAKDVSKALRSVNQQSIRQEITQDLPQHLAAAASTTKKVPPKVSINRLMNNNDSPSIDTSKSSAKLLNNSPIEFLQKSLVELPQKKILAIAGSLFLGTLAVSLLIVPILQQQYRSVNGLSSDINSDPTDLNISADPQNNNNLSIANRETIKGFTEAIERNPRDANSYFQRGNIRSNAKDKKGAILDYNKSIALNPKESEVYSQRGNAYSAIGNKKAAIKDYTQVIRLEPDRVDAYFHRAIDRSNIGDKKGALEDYNRVIKLEPNRADAYFDRGNTRAALGDKKGAMEDLTKSIQYKPSRAATYKSRGNVRAAMGDKQGAAQDYSQASKLSKQ
jgi:serine/threonine protein kinase